MLERIWRRRLDPTLIISPELGVFLCECAHEIDRQVGILVDRRGNIEHVIVGDQQKLYLPELGPRRAGESRLRGVRLVHTHLRGEELTRDDLTDLSKLRLDLVAAIRMRPGGTPGPLDFAHLLPKNPKGELWQKFESVALRELTQPKWNFLEVIASLDEEFASKSDSTRKALSSGNKGDRAVLVHIQLGRMTDEESEARVTELKELCRTAGVQVIDVMLQRRAALDPRTLVGKGKLEELVLRALQDDATHLIFDQDLMPAQARTVGDATELKVLDRTMLILDIFSQHAKSRDGKLQVELAQLRYSLPRLHEKSTMLSRLTGGIGGRGPGETKLEVNRRRAKDKIHELEQQIEKIGHERAERRSLRDQSALPLVAIVGYTNAGKSTLLNTLTGGDALVANKLFATLDPTSRRLRLSDREVILTDTVGFIRDLPEELMAAFRATLEELQGADLLLHLVDGADTANPAQLRAVEKILGELELGEKSRLVVFNKIDRLSDDSKRDLARDHLHAFLISARDKSSTKSLLAAIEQQLAVAT